VFVGTSVFDINIWRPPWGRGELVHMVSTRNMTSNDPDVPTAENNQAIAESSQMAIILAI